ncbi:interleukin-17F-like [Heptranchias perlo]|uniref:interleukin-17F-like n=1 Tax=Heptranchias perlo TaxID=212740 RepID=UPI00355AA220
MPVTCGEPHVDAVFYKRGSCKYKDNQTQERPQNRDSPIRGRPTSRGSPEDSEQETVTAVLVIILSAILAEPASGAKVRNTRKADHQRLKRKTQKYILEFEGIKPQRKWNSMDSMASFRNRSLSPWIYKEDSDPNRYPSSIFKAECVSTQCLNSRGIEDPGLNSRPIQQEMIVLRRNQVNQKITYRVEKLMIPVACVCVRPEVLSA